MSAKTRLVLVTAVLLQHVTAVVGRSQQAGIADLWHSDAESERKISVVSALLPPRGIGPEAGDRGKGARLRVEASGGCYAWESQRPDLIRIEMPDVAEAPSDALDCLERRAAECLDRAEFRKHLYHIGDPQAQRGCQPVAILRSVAREVEGVEKVLVYAKDINMPDVRLMCEVYLANIAKLEVETQVRHIKIGEVGKLSARAFDDDGNVFSSLEGMDFEWQVGDQKVLRPLQTSDTALKLSPSQQSLVEDGVQPDVLLVRGAASGRSSVEVRLPQASFRVQKQSEKREFIVSEHLVVMPAVLRLPPLSSMPLRLVVYHGRDTQAHGAVARGSAEQVALPSPHFRWFAEPVSKLSASSRRGEVTVSPVKVHEGTGRLEALQEGVARVIVQDSRIENNTASTMVYISTIATLDIASLPTEATMQPLDQWDEVLRLTTDALHNVHSLPRGAQRWQFVLGRKYAVILEAQDDSGQRLQLPPNFRADFRCKTAGDDGPCQLHTLSKSANLALLFMEAVELGVGELIFENASIVEEVPSADAVVHNLPGHLQALRPFRVVAPLTLKGPFSGPVVLPPKHSYRLPVHGGTGQYSFTLVTEEPAGGLIVTPDGVLLASDAASNAEVLVTDAENVANNLTIQVLVRDLAEAEFAPPSQHVLLEGAEADSSPFLVPVMGLPRATDGERIGAREWLQLRFWNCSGVFSKVAIATESADDDTQEKLVPSHALQLQVSSSDPAVADVQVALPTAATSSEFCAVAAVLPKQSGEFYAQGLAVGSANFSTRARLQVYEELELAVSHPQPLEALAVSMSSPSRPLHLAMTPCTAVMLHVLKGPLAMSALTTATLNLSSAVQDTHVRIQQVSDRTFEVLCLSTTPVGAAAHLVAELTLEDDAKGIFRTAAEAWVSCEEAASVEIVPITFPAAKPAAQEPTRVQPLLRTLPRSMSFAGSSASLGLRVGHLQQFWIAHYTDAGRLLISNADVVPAWSMVEKVHARWLAVDQAGVATLQVSAIGGSEESEDLVLQAKVGRLPKQECRKLRGLDATHAARVEETAKQSLLDAALALRAATSFAVSWPGFPSRHLPYSTDWAFPVQVRNGSRLVQLQVLPGVESTLSVELVDRGSICSTGAEDDLSCFRNAGTGGAAVGGEWFLRSLTPGEAEVLVEDPGTMGSEAWRGLFTFHPLARVQLAVEGADVPLTAPALLLRMQRQRLDIQVWDTLGHAISSPALWRSIGLEVESGHPRLRIEEDASSGAFYAIGELAGFFDLQAHVRSSPSTLLFSNVLRVQVLDPLSLSPKRVSVIPGQTFELTLEGGAVHASQSEAANITFSSSDDSVAAVTMDGLVIARTPGKARIAAAVTEVGTMRVLEEATADVQVESADTVQIEQSGEEGVAISPMVLRLGSSVGARLTAVLKRGEVQLTPYLLSAVAGSGGRSSTKGCSFAWTCSNPALVMLKPVTFTEQGAVAVDIVPAIPENRFPANTSVTISVEARCPASRPLTSSRQLEIVQPLRLTVPNITAAPDHSSLDAGPSVSPPLLRLPVEAEVPLAFNRPHDNLQVELLGLGARTVKPSLLQVLDDGTSIQLQTGADEGEAILVVRDLQRTGEASALMVMVAVRRPRTLRLLPPLRRLPVGSTAELGIWLADASGSTLVLPDNYRLVSTVSHHSVVSAQIDRVDGGTGLLRVHGLAEGCAAVNVSAAHGTSADHEALEDVLVVCTVPSIFADLDPLVLHPGSEFHAPRPTFPLQDSSRVAFSIRLAGDRCERSNDLPGLVQDLSFEVSALLHVPRARVGVLRYGCTLLKPRGGLMPRDEAACGSLGVEVAFEVNFTDAVDGRSVVADLWSAFQTPSKTSTPLMEQLLDLRYGIQDIDVDQSLQVCGKTVGCRQDGWSSSAPEVVTVDAITGKGVALSPGTAVLHFCTGAVHSEITVKVGTVSTIRIQAPRGGLMLGNSSVTNILDAQASLVFPLQIFAEDSQEGSLELSPGPFTSQLVDAQCRFTTQALYSYFSIETVSFANATSSMRSEMMLGFGASIAERSKAAPALACVVRTKSGVDWHTLSASWPPSQLEVDVAVLASLPWYQPTVEGQRSLAFVPRFVVIGQAGEALKAGAECLRLHKDELHGMVLVWTGGQILEAQWSGLDAETQRSLKITTGSSHGGSSTTVPVGLSWMPPPENDFAVSKEVFLRLEVPASGQVEVFKVTLAGDAPPSVAGPETKATTSSSAVWMLLPLFLTVLLMAAGYTQVQKRKETRPQPRFTPPVVGSTPFRSVAAL